MDRSDMNRQYVRVAILAVCAVALLGMGAVGVTAADDEPPDEDELEFEAYVTGEEGYLNTNANDDNVDPSEFTTCEDFAPTDDELDHWEEEQSYAPQPQCIQLFAEEMNEDGEFEGDMFFPPTLIEEDHDILGDVYAETDIETVDGASGQVEFGEDGGLAEVNVEVDIGITLYDIDEHGDEYDEDDAITDETCHIPSVELETSTEKDIDGSDITGERLDDEDSGILVANDFAIDEAEDCGSFAGTDLNGAISDEQGLPADEGDAEVVFDMHFDEPQPTGTLEGTVTSQDDVDIGDGGDGEPIEGATVEFDGQATTTDENGSFSMTVAEGSGTAEASALGHSSDSATVEIVEDEATEQDFELEAVEEYVVQAPSVAGEQGDVVEVPVEFDPVTDDSGDIENFELTLEYDDSVVSFENVTEADFAADELEVTEENGSITVEYGSLTDFFADGGPANSTAFYAEFYVDAEADNETELAFNESQSLVNEEIFDEEFAQELVESLPIAGDLLGIVDGLLQGDFDFEDLVDMFSIDESDLAEAADAILEGDEVATGSAGVVYDDGEIRSVLGEGWITGVVYDDGEDPIEEAHVELMDERNETVETYETAENGTFDMQAYEGYYTVNATADDHYGNETSVSLTSGETVEAVLSLEEVADEPSGPVGPTPGVDEPRQVLPDDEDETEEEIGSDEGDEAEDVDGEADDQELEPEEAGDEGEAEDEESSDEDTASAVFESSMASTGFTITLIAIAGAVIIGIGSMMGPALLPPRYQE